MRLFAFSLLAFAVLAHAWLLIEVDPSAPVCKGLVYETFAVVSVEVLVILLGCCGILRSLLVPLSAVVVVLASRLSLYVESSRKICLADIHDAKSSSLLLNDDVYERSMLASWIALIVFGLGLLLMHCDSVSCGMFDCFGCFSPSHDDCDDPCADKNERLPMVRQLESSCDCDESAPRKVWIKIRRN